MSGDLKLNKIMGAGLATVLVILGVREVSTQLFAAHPPEKMGYFIEVAEAEEAAGPEAAPLMPDWGTVLTTADLEAGANAFKRCASCHTINQGGPNGVGPNLWGTVGNAIGSHAGYAYSSALRDHAAASPVWTYDELYKFIEAPQRWVPGTKMSFAGIRNQQERINLVAYMRAQDSAPQAIPAPDPARQPGAVEVPPGAAGVADAVAPGVGGGAAGQAPVAGPGAAPTEVAPTPGGGEPKGKGAVLPHGGSTTQAPGAPR